MTPTFTDFFKSFYYSNTYLPPIDLSKQSLSKHLLEKKDPLASETVQRLISIPEVQQILSTPITYDKNTALQNNAVLQRHGFNLLSSKLDVIGNKISFYNVIAHDDLQEWVIKSGAATISKNHFALGPMNDRYEMALRTAEDSILSIQMSVRVAAIAREANIEVIIPKKMLVAYTDSSDIMDVTKKYCVVCEKIETLSMEETVQAIKGMSGHDQTLLAQRISTIVQRAGFVNASFENIRLTAEGKLAFIETEPTGLMVFKKPGLWNKFFGIKGASVEKCARIGLFQLKNQALNATYCDNPSLVDLELVEPGLEAFHKQIKNDCAKVSNPLFSKRKIALSIASLGLIPLINAVIAIVKTQLTARVFKTLSQIEENQKNIGMKFVVEKMHANSQTAASLDQKYLESQRNFNKQKQPLLKQFYTYIEGVPYIAKYPRLIQLKTIHFIS
ncbi:Uncharacterized protein PHSC3_001681 [Chlamydiales bacterium STE3]|nr:Uncharacterized protein PHSC3_001681 [Chlamydiales bacterium STE3]